MSDHTIVFLLSVVMAVFWLGLVIALCVTSPDQEGMVLRRAILLVGIATLAILTIQMVWF